MKNTKKRGRGSGAALVLAMTLVFSLAACAQKQTAPQGGKALKKLEVPVATNNIGLPLLVIAHELKFFEEEGLAVNLQTLNTGGNVDQLMAVSTGKIDLANSGGTNAPLLFIEQGNELVIIGGTMGEGAALISRPENTAQYENFSAESLYGKKVGAIRANTGDVALRGWLARQGADLTKIIFVELDSYPTVIEAVRKGEIDAGHVAVNWRIVANSQGLPTVLHIDEVVPNFSCCRISVTRKNLNARRDDYVAFLKALIRAYKVFSLEQEKALDITDRFYDADRETLKTNYYTYGHYILSPDPAKNRILEYYRGMAAIGYAKGTADIPAHIDSSLYRDALDQLLAENPGDSFYQDVKRHFDENN